MSLSILFGLTVAVSGSATAQFVEPDVHVLLERSLGPAINNFGYRVVALNDVNGDGVVDLGTADMEGPAFQGRVYALSGIDGHTLWTRTGSTNSLLGRALERMDWNSDGVLDVVAGAPASFIPQGEVWVHSGVDGAALALLFPTLHRDYWGEHLASGGNLDGDGIGDLMVSEADFGTLEGRVDVFRRGGTTPFFTLVGADEFEAVGSSLAFLGDVSIPPDGRDEIAVGTGLLDFTSGGVRVIGWNGSGAVVRYILTLPDVALDLAGGRDVSGDGRPDFAAASKTGVRAYSGVNGGLVHTLGAGARFDAVVLLADVDGDSVADIAAGVPLDSSGASHGGKVVIWSGASGALLKTITATTPNLQLGTDLREMGDLDGDGKGALLVGAVGDEIDQVARELKARGKVRQDIAEEILAALRAGK